MLLRQRFFFSIDSYHPRKKPPDVYEIKSFGDEVDLDERNNFKDPAKLKAIRISFEQLYTKWSFYKGELPQYIEDDWAPYMAKQHAELNQEMAKH